MYIVVGLGNPGKQYDGTYHNMGYTAVDMLADKLGVRFKDKRCQAVVGEVYINSDKVVLAKPVTYMNLSGDSVRELMGYYKAGPDSLVVMYDDIDLVKGTLRIRREGSAGTHNGMRDIVSKLGTGQFLRIRIGIGRPGEYMDLKDYVLSRPRGENAALQTKACERAARAAYEYVSGAGAEAIMRKYHT